MPRTPLCVCPGACDGPSILFVIWAVSLCQWKCGSVHSEGDSGLKMTEEPISGAYFTASTASGTHECCHIRRPRLRHGGASCCTKPCHGQQLLECRFSWTGTARLQYSRLRLESENGNKGRPGSPTGVVLAVVGGDRQCQDHCDLFRGNEKRPAKGDGGARPLLGERGGIRGGRRQPVVETLLYCIQVSKRKMGSKSVKQQRRSLVYTGR